MLTTTSPTVSNERGGGNGGRPRSLLSLLLMLPSPSLRSSSSTPSPSSSLNCFLPSSLIGPNTGEGIGLGASSSTLDVSNSKSVVDVFLAL